MEYHVACRGPVLDSLETILPSRSIHKRPTSSRALNTQANHTPARASTIGVQRRAFFRAARAVDCGGRCGGRRVAAENTKKDGVHRAQLALQVERVRERFF